MSKEAFVQEMERQSNEKPMYDKTVVDKCFASNVQHPSHYNQGQFEVIDVIEDWNLGFNLGNAIKYAARAEHKGKELEDLKKGAWYMLRRIRERFPEMRDAIDGMMENLK